MNLRLRLTLLILVMFVFGTAAVVGRVIITAREEVNSELVSTQVLTNQLLTMMFRETLGYLDSSRYPDMLEKLMHLQPARHFSIDIVPLNSPYVSYSPFEDPGIEAPDWFVRLLDIDDSILTVQFGEIDANQILFRTDPIDEINEIWEETRITLLYRLLALLIFNLVIYLGMGFWLRPLGRISSNLKEMVKGDYSRRVPAMGLPELNEVAEQINHLASVLGESKSENERLNQRALTIQEQDRRRFSQELHDSLGQAVSAIKAMAVSIFVRTETSDPAVAESAMNIERISEAAYGSVRGMMAWLRPAILDELGLVLALEQMVDDWNLHHEDSFCKLSISGDFELLGEQQKIHLFRIVQEALTNIVKHANAELVTIKLSGGETIALSITDNGIGFSQDKVRAGMGLSGIRDRVMLLQGELSISSVEGQGTTITLEIPRTLELRRRWND